MAPLFGVLVALAALGEGAVTPNFGGNFGGGNESGPGGGGAGPPWNGAPRDFGGSLAGSLAVLAAAYLGLGGAVLAGLHLRHRALKNRKRRRLNRRFFRASPPEPQNLYGNVPGARPSPPQGEDEEGEGSEGYEEPGSGNYENAPGGGADSASYENLRGRGLD